MCFFTGHRIIEKTKIDTVKEKVKEHIERIIAEHGVDTFISGGAIGFDMIAANCVYEMKEKYPHIKLEIYIPCLDQSKRWTNINKYYYRMMLSKADNQKFISNEEYADGCMLKRNMEMIKDSSYCIAYCVTPRTGTGVTVRMAKQENIEVVNIADEI